MAITKTGILSGDACPEENAHHMSALEKALDRKILREYRGEGCVITVPFDETCNPSTIGLLAHIYRRNGWRVHLDTDYLQIS